MNEPAPDVVHAGFVRRFAAYIIDGFILGIAYYALVFALLIVMVALAPGVANGSDDDMATLIGAVYLLLVLLYYPCAGLYYALQESSSHQATLGKRAMGIKVTDARGQRIGTAQAFGRWFAALLSYATLYIGFFMAGFTERKRALHDMLADTLVVDRHAYTDTPERQQRHAGAAVILVVVVVLFFGIAFLGILAAIAIPAYQDYTIRAKVADAMAQANPVKQAVAAHRANQGTCPANGEAGILAAEAYASPNVSRITVGSMDASGRCAIEVTLVELGPGTDGQRIWLELDPDGEDPDSGDWDCSAEVEDRYLPAACRG